VSAISSAMEKMAFLNSSKAIGSRLADIGTGSSVLRSEMTV